MKRVLIIVGSLMILVAVFGVLGIPCTPPSERARCKKEIGILRGYLLSKDHYGIKFFSAEFLSSTNGLDFCVGMFCDRVNQIANERIGKDVFRVRPSPNGKGKVIVDRWGTPYNFCTVEECQRNHWDALRYCEISNIVVWSSGPNKINEHGSNDDVTLRIRRCLQVDDLQVKRP